MWSIDSLIHRSKSQTIFFYLSLANTEKLKKPTHHQTPIRRQNHLQVSIFLIKDIVCFKYPFSKRCRWLPSQEFNDVAIIYLVPDVEIFIRHVKLSRSRKYSTSALDYGISPDRATAFKEKDWDQVVFVLRRLQPQFSKLYRRGTVEPDWFQWLIKG